MPQSPAQQLGLDTGKRSDLVSLAVVVSHIAAALGPMYVGIVWGAGWWWLAIWVWTGVTLNGLVSLMHETSHYLTFQPQWASEVLGRWVLGPILSADFDAYRERHWGHHAYLGTERDTKEIYLLNIRGFRVVTLLLRSVLLTEAWGKIRMQVGQGARAQARPAGLPAWMWRAVPAHMLIVGGMAAAAQVHHPNDALAIVGTVALVYFGVYFYSGAALTNFLAALRGIAEHQIGAGEIAVEGHAAIRNLRCNRVTWYVFGMYGFDDHAAHHLDANVPYYHLPAVTRARADTEPAWAPTAGYGTVLARLIRRPAAAAGA